MADATASLMMPYRRFLQWPVAWAAICALYAIDFLWALHAGLTIGGTAAKALCIITPLAIALALRRRDSSIAKLAEGFALWFAFAGAITVLTYLAATFASPLKDAALERADRAIGFDWLWWSKTVTAQPYLSRTLLFAYNSLPLQILISIIYFSPTKSERIGETVLLAIAAAIPTTLISAIWPVLGPFASNGIDDAFLHDLHAMRSGGPWHFELASMQGIVQMPSFHTTLAMLFIYAFRGTGLIGYLIAALNLVMLLAVPPIGGHYLVDVIAGAAMAVGFILIRQAMTGLKRLS